jgi:hypothetical protein
MSSHGQFFPTCQQFATMIRTQYSSSMIRTQYSSSIRVFRANSAGAYISTAHRSYLAEQGTLA